MNVAIIYVITMRIITVIPNLVLCIHLASDTAMRMPVSLPSPHWIISKHIMQCSLSDCELITIRIWWIQSGEMGARGGRRARLNVCKIILLFSNFAKFTFTKFDATDVFELCHVMQLWMLKSFDFNRTPKGGQPDRVSYTPVELKASHNHGVARLSLQPRAC